MEACTMKPQVKKEAKLVKRSDPENLEKPAPLVPLRPSDTELSQTQYRMKRAATANDQSYVSDNCDKDGKSDDVSAKRCPCSKPEKGGAFGGIFKRSSRLADCPAAEEEEPSDDESEQATEEGGGLFSRLLRKAPKASGERTESPDREAQKEQSASSDDLSESNTTKELEMNRENQFLGSCENLFDPTGPKERSIFSGMFNKAHQPAEGATTDEGLNTGEDLKLSASWENLLEAATSKEKTRGLAGIFKKSPKPALRSIATKDPLSDTKDVSDSLVDTAEESDDMESPEGGRLRRRRTIKRSRRVVSFRVKKTLPSLPKLGLTSQSSDKIPVMEETVELQELSPAQEPVETAACPPESEQESNELMEWWNTVKGWTDWNETSNFQEGDEETAMEQAADRVYMAARLFVHLFNQRGASLQHRILELLALADAADQFHKKTLTAAVGGGVASVAGSVTTITGLILAPFTFGASIIVTAVGIGVATAGSITSATANITDTVHSNMDRKKLEKMIQSYQEEIKDIRECLEFVQDGMNTLQEWDFEKYSERAAKKALNHNLKHVMKEGGRAGKALMINTDKLISTVQVLGVAGGAAKAAQAISITTGVMSALFLALDVFFLAKDSHKLRKGAKTKFATKIRGVCKDLQDGLLELNKVKTQLQKTMDGIEVEAYEEIEEVEVEVDDDLESDPKKLAELEQELDLLELKLDKKVEEEQKKMKEMEKDHLKSKKEKREKSMKEKGEPEEKKNKEEKEEETGEKDAKKEGKKERKKGKGEEERKAESKLEKISDEEKEPKNETVKAAKEDVLKAQSQKGWKKDKEAENRITASKRDKVKEESGTNKRTDEKEKETNETGKEQEEIKSRSGESKREHWSGKAYSERERERSKSSTEDERGMNQRKDAESGSTRRHGSRSDKDGPHRRERRREHETTDTERVGGGKQSDRTESRRRTEEDRGVRGWSEDKRESQEGRRSKRETKRGRAQHDDRTERGEEKGGRRQSERAGGEEEEREEERGRRKEDGASQRRRASDRQLAHHSRRRPRARGSVLLEDGLNI